MREDIDGSTLRSIWAHQIRLEPADLIRGVPYERCAELPYVVDLLRPRFDEGLAYLDIGTGASPLPTFLLRNTRWDVTCVDKFSSVRTQHTYLERLKSVTDGSGRFKVVERDIFEADLPQASFDIISIISVIEHMEGDRDMRAMELASSLLKPGGWLVLSTPVNEGFPREYYLDEGVYGERPSEGGVFYQRHYDVAGVNQRLVRASGLRELSRVYFGEYGYQAFERLLQAKPKMLRLWYQWATPILARRFLEYRDFPVGRRDMLMNTASGVIVLLEK